jgi:DNA-binding NarL/FixJ family response regulator
LADDHKVVRQALRTAMEREASLTVAGEADDGRQAVKMALDLKPDVVLMDIHMPGLNGTEATRQIKEQAPKVKVVVLSMYSQKQYVMAALQAGADGFLRKSCSMEELLTAIGQAAKGGSYISPEVAGTVMELVRQPQPLAEEGGLALLTPREREIVQMVAEGSSTKEIAGQIHLSEATVDTHRRNIMRKLGLKGVAELTRFAIREGLVSLDD